MSAERVTAVNLAGDGVILGRQIHKGRDVRVTYANTPTFDRDDIPLGRAAHIGDGVWRKVCRECPDYVETYGAPWLCVMELGRHEREHGLDVLGMNIAMLP